MADSAPIRTHTERADQTRARILEAATREFSENGLMGARTEHIAEAAGVNKAMLYYYFQGKEALYGAALEAVAERIAANSLRALGMGGSPGERLLHAALHHFDRIYSEPVFQKLMQQEMIRMTRGEPNGLSPMVELHFKPLSLQTRTVIEEGIASGELVAVDAMQVMYAALGANVFYFLSAPMMRMIGGEGFNPFTRESLQFRRKAAIEYLGMTIFSDREHGRQAAERVLAARPMPEIIEAPVSIGERAAKHGTESAPAAAEESRRK